MFPLIFLCSYVSVLPLIFAANPPCVYDVSGGRTLDIRPLGLSNGKGPKYDNIVITSPIPYTFSWNACFDYKKSDGGDCTSAAACYTDKRSGVSTLVASHQNVEFEENSGLYQLIYHTAGSVLTVTLTCKDSDQEIITGRQDDAKTFDLFLTTRCACPGLCQHVDPSSGDGSLGGGAVFVIILLVVGFVYLVGGMLFLRFRQGATGSEMIPNRTMWLSLGSYAKTGVQFSIDTICQRKRSTDYQSI